MKCTLSSGQREASEELITTNFSPAFSRPVMETKDISWDTLKLILFCFLSTSSPYKLNLQSLVDFMQNI